MKVLTDNQFRRLVQVTMQLRGIDIFVHPEIVNRLRLTADQQMQVAAIRRSKLEKTRALNQKRKQGKITRTDYAIAADQIGSESLAVAVSLLTAEQRKVFDELCGCKIRFRPRELQLTIQGRHHQHGGLGCLVGDDVCA